MAQTDRVESYLLPLVEKDIFSGSVLIAKEGRVILNKGYGLANREEEINNKPQTKFRIASLTKQFTAFAIVMLQQRGKLRVSDEICNYLPECPPAWRQITIKHLLTHTSGITDFTESPDYTQAMSVPLTVTEIVDRFKGRRLEFSPGYRFRYSNSNYILLGQIIERASGRPYQAFLQENIFAPLGLHNTGYDRHSEIVKHRARGYAKSTERVINAPHIDMSIPFAAGGLYSTVEDLYVWEQSLDSEQLLSKSSLAEIFTPGPGAYGYGWYITEHLQRKLICHGGWISGFAAAIARYPAERVTIIVLGNIDTAPVNTIARNLAAILFNEKVETLVPRPPPGKVDSAAYEQYAGEYQLTANLVVRLNRQGERLICQATGYASMELLPASEGTFFVSEVGAQVSFIKDEHGAVTACRITMDGSSFIAQKVK